MIIETVADFRKAHPYWNKGSWYPADFCRRMRQAYAAKDWEIAAQKAAYEAWYLAKHGIEYGHEAALAEAARVQMFLDDEAQGLTLKTRFENLTQDAVEALREKVKKYKMVIKITHAATQNGKAVFSGGAYA